jgi:integrase
MPRMAPVGQKPKVQDREYLRPDEARRLIEAAGMRGRYPSRDKVLVRMVYRHGLRVSEAVGVRWSQVDLDQGVIHIARLKGSKDSTHSLDRHELRDLRKLRQHATGLYVFETERAAH